MQAAFRLKHFWAREYWSRYHNQVPGKTGLVPEGRLQVWFEQRAKFQLY